MATRRNQIHTVMQFSLDFLYRMALHKGGYATPMWVGDDMNANNNATFTFWPVTPILSDTHGNASHLLGAFAAQAQQQGSSKDAIVEVQHEAMAGDYNQLIRTLAKDADQPSDTGA